MNDIINFKVYDLARKEFKYVKWDGYPYGRITSHMALTLKNHYFSDIPFEDIFHDCNWAYAIEIGCGCEEERF